MSKKEKTKSLKQSAINGLLIVEIKKLLEQYRDEEMPNWNTPYHYNAEGWATIKYFIEWLEGKKQNQIKSKISKSKPRVID